MIARVLEQSGAEVRACASSSEALKTIERWWPDVLVADIAMPEEDGYELLSKLRVRAKEHKKYLPAIALTAYASTEDRRRSLMAGFQVHLAKPVEPTYLVSIVAIVIGQVGENEEPADSAI